MTKRVPAKLHHELSEYASLLRALRVRDTMDVTKHITQSSPFALNTTNDQVDEDGLEDISPSTSHPPSTILSDSRASSVQLGSATLPSSEKSGNAKSKGKQKAVETGTAKKPKKRRDHWTRWPLLLDDLITPEWSLEDEVAVIVAQIMKGRPSPVFPVPVAEDIDAEDEEDKLYTGPELEYDEEDPDPPFYVPYITSIIANYLSMILAALACLIPARTAGFQNRIEPLGWRTILDVFVACAPSEFANPQIVENVIHRMEAIYGPSIIPLEGEKSTSLRAVERIHSKTNATQKVRERIDEESAKYWNSSIPEHQVSGESKKPEAPVKKVSRKRKRPRTPATEEESTSMEEGAGHASRIAQGEPPTTTPVPEEQNPPQQEINAATENQPIEQSTTRRKSKRARITRKFNFPSEEYFRD